MIEMEKGHNKKKVQGKNVAASRQESQGIILLVETHAIYVVVIVELAGGYIFFFY